ncbi:hypothetical protein [Clostridium tetani]|uniref:hypothetical protein n=1 Tax=Clostridium tetani TaxID=1513 RepID=UPI0024A926F8|nr:hypothetical protein [Clostridium tetani]
MIIYVQLKINEEEEPILRVIENSNVSGLVSHDILLTTGFGLHLANYTLGVLDTGIDIKFENFNQYNKVISDVNNVVITRCKNMDTQVLYRCINS